MSKLPWATTEVETDPTQAVEIMESFWLEETLKITQSNH